MDVSQIIQNNQQMFEILNKAQTKENEFSENVAEYNIKNKIQKGKENTLGQLIDLYV